MYQIKCDNYILYDPREDDLILHNPKCKLEVNTVGSASFTIFATHPYYDRLQKLRSVFEVSESGKVIFRGRMTEDSRDFENRKAVDIEGMMACFNDSVVRPFNFPEDFEDNKKYQAAQQNGNVVAFFLGWLIDNHNGQVEDFQKLKLGNVTVTDTNNALYFESSDYNTTWSVIESRLFKGSLGGYICIRYEDDGNYIDYLSDFEYTNVQRITYGENLLDISTDSNANAVYTAVVPLGMKMKEINSATDDDSRLTIASIADGDIDGDIVKVGDMLYSRSARQKYGFICAPTKDTTFDDVTKASNLLDKGKAYLSGTAIKLNNTIEIKAVDLHFADDEIAAFRIYRNILVYSKPHDHEGLYRLTKLDIDIMNPQNTNIVLGDTVRTLTDINASIKQNMVETEKIIKIQSDGQQVDISNLQSGMTDIRSSISEQTSTFVTTCEAVIMEAASKYVESSAYTAFTEEVRAQLQLMSDSLNISLTAINDRVENVDGDLQEKFNQVTKYFTFDINGLTIGQADNPYKVVIDNDRYSMYVNGIEVLWFDGEGKAHIPEISVTRKVNIFGYVLTEDEDGKVTCDYVGGDA